MGADLWHQKAPWQPDAATALRQLQIDLFQSTYDFAEEFDRHRSSARQAVELTERDGDRFRLLTIYKRHLDLIEDIASRPLPTDPAQQMSTLRTIIEGISPDGFRSILDVTGIDATGGINKARLLPREEIAKITGIEKPTSDQTNDAALKIAAKLGRGESAAFAVYDASGNPKSWHFVGLTTD